ncbi:MAG: gliding motility-associated C-terminal domain-containing protein [Saprospiraceae bacterium]
MRSFGCDGTPVTIDASATGNAADFADISWESNNSFTETANPFIINANNVGEYILTVTIESPVTGCVVSETFTVVPDANTPVAVVGDNVELMCGETATLDATNSTPPSNVFVYNWQTIDGPDLTTGANGPTPAVAAEGAYQLIVTNVENGCADTSAVVQVTLVLPAAANAGTDIVACEGVAELDATAVAGTTGVWTTASGATIEMENDPATAVSNLTAGANVFVWTLSAPGCPDYSSDAITVTLPSPVIAAPDMLNIEAGAGMGEISLITNDNIGGSNNFSINVLSPPAFGTYDTMALNLGTLALTVPVTQFGTTEMTYELCNTDCPNICDTTTVTINVQRGDEIFVPNTITPNDDGANDQLIFDVLLFGEADEFPDNELIIFSRWGDILYQAKPYNNDWTGVNQSGEPVPEGTYYYVLRLNISRGEIVRGDITIIR